MWIMTIALISAIIAPNIKSQNARPIIAPERQMDFWVGEWSGRGKQRASPTATEWKETKCTNSVRAILDGNVIEENFEGADLKGKSVSVYNAVEKKWKQMI